MSALKGFIYDDVSLRKVKKDKFILCPELEAKVKREELEGMMKKVLLNKGKVYFIIHKRLVYGVLAFAFEEHLASEFIMESSEESEASKSNYKKLGEKLMEETIEFDNKTMIGTKKSVDKLKDKANRVNAYNLVGEYLTAELEAKIADVKQDVINYLKSSSFYSENEIKAIIWDKDALVDRTAGKSHASAAVIGVSCGILFGICFGGMFGLLFDYAGGEFYGILIGGLFGYIIGASYYGKATLSEKGDVVEKVTE